MALRSLSVRTPISTCVFRFVYLFTLLFFVFLPKCFLERRCRDSVSFRVLSMLPPLKVPTGYPADVIRFFPFDSGEERLHFFVCGTYQLVDGATQQKTGKLLFGSVDEHSSSEGLQIKHQFDIASEAILDLKFIEDGLERALVTADAQGQLTVYALSGTLPFDHVEQRASWRSGCEQFMYLSLDVSVGNSILASRNDGHVDYWRHISESQAATASWQAHEYDAWICRFDRHQPNLVYSGGDDGLLKLWDMREDVTLPSLTLRSKLHTAGVTAIESHPKEPFVFCSGSYDKCIYVWDHRAMRRPLFSPESPGQGGIWRLVWHAENKYLLLAACMYGGLSIYSYDRSEHLVPLYDYAEHTSIVYGADWKASSRFPNHSLIASCSFYDEAMHFHYHTDPVHRAK